MESPASCLAPEVAPHDAGHPELEPADEVLALLLAPQHLARILRGQAVVVGADVLLTPVELEDVPPQAEVAPCRAPAVRDPELGLRPAQPELGDEEAGQRLPDGLGAGIGEADRLPDHLDLRPAPHRHRRRLDRRECHPPPSHRVQRDDTGRQPVLARDVDGGPGEVETGGAVSRRHDLVGAVGREVVLDLEPRARAVDAGPGHVRGGDGRAQDRQPEGQGRGLVTQHVRPHHPEARRPVAHELTVLPAGQALPRLALGVHTAPDGDPRARAHQPVDALRRHARRERLRPGHESALGVHEPDDAGRHRRGHPPSVPGTGIPCGPGRPTWGGRSRTGRLRTWGRRHM